MKDEIDKISLVGKKFTNKRGFEYEVVELNEGRLCTVYFSKNNFYNKVDIRNAVSGSVREVKILPINISIGEKFGELTVVGFCGSSGVNLKCSCGGGFKTSHSVLKGKRKSSCGCIPTTEIQNNFWGRFGELMKSWNPDTHKPSVKKLPIFSFTVNGRYVEKIVAFTYVDSEFYDVWKEYPFVMSRGYPELSRNKCVYTKIKGSAAGWRKKSHHFLHHIVRGHSNFGNYIVDHINGRILDNRFKNLRTASHIENSRNQHKPKGNYSSNYKGVSFISTIKPNKNGRYRPWRATLISYGKLYSRHFETEIEAALAYNELAKEHYGEFAKLNIIKLEND